MSFKPGDRVYTTHSLYFKRNGLSLLRPPGQWCTLEDMPLILRDSVFMLPMVLVTSNGARAPAYEHAFVSEAEGQLIENTKGIT